MKDSHTPALHHVALLAGGPSDERTISLLSARSAHDALVRAGVRVTSVRVCRDGRWAFGVLPGDSEPEDNLLSPGRALAELEALAPDAVLNLIHGPYGEDGTLQGALDVLGMAYMGSGVLASALAMNKPHSKAVLAAAGVPVAQGLTVRSAAWATDAHSVHEAVAALGFPVFVKPSAMGSSLGSGRANDAVELDTRLTDTFAHAHEALIEPLLVGREFTVPVLEDPHTGKPEALAVIEIRPIGHAFFDFTSKYTPGHNEELCPAPLDGPTTALLQELGLRAHFALGCEGLSRTDAILTAAGPVVLEVNTLPGLTTESLIIKAAAHGGLDLGALIVGQLRLAKRRRAQRQVGPR